MIKLYTAIGHLFILYRAALYLVYVFVLWAFAGIICFNFIHDPLMIYLFGSINMLLISGSGLLLCLDPKEQKEAAEKQNTSFKLLKLICEQYQCSIADVRGSSRKREFVNPRAIFAYALRKYWDWTFDDIGLEINRDHTTVIHFVKRTEDLLFTKDELTCQTVKLIEEKLFNQ